MPKAALFAGDIMQTELVTIRPNDSVREAMALMVDSHVSGLPVVDGRGHCVGVLSVTDVLGWNTRKQSRPVSSRKSARISIRTNSDGSICGSPAPLTNCPT
jgi:CBS domain-containing protein